MIQRVSKRDQKLDTLKSVYGGSGRTTVGNSYFLDYQTFPVEKGRKKSTAAKLVALETKTGKGRREKEVSAKQAEQWLCCV